MGVAGIGQDFNVVRAMVVILDDNGQAQAWEFRDGTARWDFAGVAEDDGVSLAKVTMKGKFKRTSRTIAGRPMGELLE